MVAIVKNNKHEGRLSRQCGPVTHITYWDPITGEGFIEKVRLEHPADISAMPLDMDALISSICETPPEVVSGALEHSKIDAQKRKPRSSHFLASIQFHNGDPGPNMMGNIIPGMARQTVEWDIQPPADPDLIERVKRHEGFSSTVYKDSLGYPTIGYGHRVESVTPTQMSKEYAEDLLIEDLKLAQINAVDLFYPDIWPKLNEVRKNVLIEMVFQLGKTGVSKFVKMKAALEKEDYQEAANQMILSLWYEQTTNRCVTLAGMMRNGLPEQ